MSDAYRPTDVPAFGGDITGTIQGKPAEEVLESISNFDNRNDRISTVPANPVVKGDGTAVDHIVNTDGSVDISFEWEFNGTGDAYNIDGFTIYVHQGASSSPYTFGTEPEKEQAFFIPANKRVFILYGVPADKYYTFGVQAYRTVDMDIDESGTLESSIVKTAHAEENPYRPSENVAFGGDITGTIDGIPAEDFADVIEGTLNYRTPGAPSNNPVPTILTTDVKPNASMDIKLGWAKYTQGARKADFLMLFWVKGDPPLSAPTVNDSNIVFNVNTGGPAYHVFEGVNPSDNWRFGIAAARKTENGVEVGPIQSPASAPDWADVTEGVPNYTGTIGDEDHPSETVISVLDGFGNGSDGEFNSTGNVTWTVTDEDSYSVVKQFKSFRLNQGHTLTVDKRCRGLFIFCQGNVIIEGTIDMSGKAAKVSKISSTQRLIQIPVGVYVVDIPPGGKGGSGGAGGDGADGTRDYDGKGGAAGLASAPDGSVEATEEAAAEAEAARETWMGWKRRRRRWR